MKKRYIFKKINAFRVLHIVIMSQDPSKVYKNLRIPESNVAK